MALNSKYYQAQIKAMIAQDETEIELIRKIKTDDGAGGFEISTETINIVGRLYNKHSVRENLNNIGLNFATVIAGEKLLTESEVDIQEKDMFISENRAYNVRFVNDYLGICKQCELEQITTAEVMQNG